jgi:superfamily II DNA or RNA helicase
MSSFAPVQDAPHVTFRVDSRVRHLEGGDEALLKSLRGAFTHHNPDFHKRRKQGFATWGVSDKIRTWRSEHDVDTFPRGGIRKVSNICTTLGWNPKFVDARVVHEPTDPWPELHDHENPDTVFELRDYQTLAIDSAKIAQQGIVRAPTGSGKSLAALALAAKIRQPTLVIMRDSNLLKQWQSTATRYFGLSSREIGVLQGSNLRIGPRLTLALQQTLYSSRFPLEKVAHHFGAVIVDEVHTLAAATFQRVIDVFPARYRIGFSADESRKDRKEFLVYDQIGEVVYEIARKELERREVVHPVEVRMIPTFFNANWYRDAGPGERDFNRLLEEMIHDVERQNQLLTLVRDIVRREETPAFIFSHRIEHARRIADDDLFALGIKCGLMLGGAENATRFGEDKRRLLAGELKVAAGTFAAIGQGIDVPNVQAGIVATPFGANRQFFGQVRGRICRASRGKDTAVLYVLWDRNVFPSLHRTVSGWNDGRTTVLDAGQWKSV